MTMSLHALSAQQREIRSCAKPLPSHRWRYSQLSCHALYDFTQEKLALNIPTFTNLYGYGYGYRNIAELDEVVALDSFDWVTPGP